MGNLIMFVIVMVAITMLPDLITKALVNLMEAFKKLCFLLVKCISAFSKALGLIAMSPVRFIKDGLDGTMFVSGQYKQSWKKQKAKKKKDTQFKQAMKAKKATVASKKLAADQHDAAFHKANAKLNMMAKKHHQTVSREETFEFSSELDTPAYIRQKIFQTDTKGQLVLDKNGYGEKTSVMGMFKQPQKSTPEEPMPTPEPEPSTSSDAPHLHLVGEMEHMQDDGFDVECDLYAGIA